MSYETACACPSLVAPQFPPSPSLARLPCPSVGFRLSHSDDGRLTAGGGGRRMARGRRKPTDHGVILSTPMRRVPGESAVASPASLCSHSGLLLLCASLCRRAGLTGTNSYARREDRTDWPQDGRMAACPSLLQRVAKQRVRHASLPLPAVRRCVCRGRGRQCDHGGGHRSRRWRAAFRRAPAQCAPDAAAGAAVAIAAAARHAGSQLRAPHDLRRGAVAYPAPAL
jgi:hypothetical protein